MIAALLLSASCGAVCSQGVCQPVIKQRVVAAPYVAQYVAPQVYYFVGAAVRAQALVTHEKQQDPEYQEFLEFKKWKAQAQSDPDITLTPGNVDPNPLSPGDIGLNTETAPPPEPTKHGATVSNTCAKCHATATPAGSFFMDGNGGMRPEDVTAAIRALVSEEMPKGKQISKQERNELLRDLLDQEVKEEK